MTQEKVLMRIHDGYLGLNLSEPSDPYIVYAACMPWGRPIGLYVTEESAIGHCTITDASPELTNWRKQNREIGNTYINQFCKVFELPLPSLLMLFSANGEPVKNPQKHILLLLEDASWIGDGLVEWHKSQTEGE